MMTLSGYDVRRDGRTIMLTAPGLGVARSIRPTEGEARRIARACRLDADVATATWHYFRAPSIKTSGAVKFASEGWRERVCAAWIERQRIAKIRASRRSLRINAACRPIDDWRSDVLAADPGATFGRSACGRFEIAFARAR